MSHLDGRHEPGRVGRLDSVLGTIMEQPAGPLPGMVCEAAAQRLRLPGVGITVAASEQILESAYATGLGATGDGLQTELGEGPAYAAQQAGVPVQAEDLVSDGRWPIFASAASAAGILASFSFPIRSGVIRLGTLNLYRPAVGPLDGDQHADALVFAHLALDLLVSPPVTDGQGSGRAAEDAWLAAESMTPQVHQATGMVSAQLGIELTDALAVLRAHSYTTGRRLADIAVAVVARTLRFEDDQR